MVRILSLRNGQTNGGGVTRLVSEEPKKTIRAKFGRTWPAYTTKTAKKWLVPIVHYAPVLLTVSKPTNFTNRGMEPSRDARLLQLLPSNNDVPGVQQGSS